MMMNLSISKLRDYKIARMPIFTLLTGFLGIVILKGWGY